jgi:simple sugar transport system permease protein
MAVASETPAPGSPAPESAPSRNVGSVLLNLGRRLLTLREGSIIVVTIIALIYFGTSTTGFFKGDSLRSLLPYFAPYAILAAGEVFVMINGEIDLSIGATWLFTPFVMFKFTDLGLPLVPALILALLVATAIGLINGFFVAYVGLASFVATLGMLFVLDGLSLIVSHATQVSPFPGTSISGTSTGTFASVFGGGTYSELFWALGIVALLQVALSFSRWGLYTVAVGGNRHGAAEAGINVKWNLIRNFAVCALLAGFAGVLEAVRAKTATPDPGASNDFLLLSIAAAVAGGTLLQGGAGTVAGALIGAVFLGVLQEGLNLKGVSANYRDLYLGLALLIAMTANTFLGRVRLGAGHG